MVSPKPIPRPQRPTWLSSAIPRNARWRSAPSGAARSPADPSPLAHPHPRRRVRRPPLAGQAHPQPVGPRPQPRHAVLRVPDPPLSRRRALDEPASAPVGERQPARRATRWISAALHVHDRDRGGGPDADAAGGVAPIPPATDITGCPPTPMSRPPSRLAGVDVGALHLLDAELWSPRARHAQRHAPRRHPRHHPGGGADRRDPTVGVDGDGGQHDLRPGVGRGHRVENLQPGRVQQNGRGGGALLRLPPAHGQQLVARGAGGGHRHPIADRDHREIEHLFSSDGIDGLTIATPSASSTMARPNASSAMPGVDREARDAHLCGDRHPVDNPLAPRARGPEPVLGVEVQLYVVTAFAVAGRVAAQGVRGHVPVLRALEGHPGSTRRRSGPILAGDLMRRHNIGHPALCAM